MGRSWFRRRADFSEVAGNDDIKVRKFSYESLQMATNNFSNDMLIDEGGFARIYKGNLSDGTQVAVKFYSQILPLHEFSGMMKAISQIRHRNIVQVIGCCIHGDHLLLVTEYVANGNLFDLLRQRRQLPEFNWNRRAAICIDIARGLSYLHKDAIPRIIHMDIKPGNILLDHNFSPKITDFDIMKLYCDSGEPQTECISGTYGYIDPEFCIYGKYSDKSDVFAFGIVMLEIISGRRAFLSSEDHIVTWASKLVNNDRVLEMIDPQLTDVASDDARHFIDVALLCVQEHPKQRPNMLDVSNMLYGVHNSSSLLIVRPDMSQLGTYFYQPDGVQEQQEQTFALNCTSTDSEDELPKMDAQQQTEQIQEPIQQQQQPGIILSGSNNIAERQSQTMVFRRFPNNCDFTEAVYPPYLTSVHRRRSSFGFNDSRRLPFP